jgi:hypothetical protein
MRASFKQRVIRAIFIVMAGFLALFIFRFVYGYSTGLSEFQEEYFSDFLSSVENVKRNYASDSYKFLKSVSYTEQADAPKAGEYNIDQKYEKTATIKSKSSKYTEDEKLLRDKIKSYNAIIQYEQNSGKDGDRELDLLVGVPPVKFDSFYVEMLKIGRIASKEITKTDKTNEFKNLNAKKASLEITRQSLLEIKRQSGKIDEYINLQNRILEIEQELQNLGVSLGDFDDENEFCTVKFSLLESRVLTISMLHRIKVAFEWSIQYYLLFLSIAGVACVFAFFLLLIIDKVIPSIINRVNQ